MQSRSTNFIAFGHVLRGQLRGNFRCRKFPLWAVILVPQLYHTIPNALYSALPAGHLLSLHSGNPSTVDDQQAQRARSAGVCGTGTSFFPNEVLLDSVSFFYQVHDVRRGCRGFHAMLLRAQCSWPDSWISGDI